MNYLKMYHDDMVNGAGVRVTLFVSGCNHGCKGCYNTASWSGNNGTLFDEAAYQSLAEQLKKPYIQGLSLSGGDPLFAGNLEDILALVQRVKEEMPDKDVWLWTGFTLAELEQSAGRDADLRRQILDYVDVLIDGKFEQDKHIPGLKFRGSTNQMIWYKDQQGQFYNALLAQDG